LRGRQKPAGKIIKSEDLLFDKIKTKNNMFNADKAGISMLKIISLEMAILAIIIISLKSF